MNVLIVDDEPLARERLSRMVGELEGYRVLEPAASNGEEALTLIDSLKPDVVLLDIRMPGLDGLQVAAKLCEREAPPAVIFCTAHDEFALEAVSYTHLDVYKRQAQIVLTLSIPSILQQIVVTAMELSLIHI